jgi:hypothetical protein
VADENFEDAPFGRGEPLVAALARGRSNPVRGQVDGPRADPRGGSLALRGGASCDGPHPGEELFDVERLENGLVT